MNRELAIWGFALGYFLSYVPYSALVKAVSDGLLPGGAKASGFEILPVSVGASLVAMFGFITALGWWKHAGRRSVLGLSVPCPGPWTFLSGLCTAAIVVTTTLAYAIPSASIVFMMLLMRGGVLCIAPVVDALTGRSVRWFSWVALALSIASLLVAQNTRAGVALPALAAGNVSVYLLAYFIRLRFMSRLAKSDDRSATIRYFVEEQMVATPVVLVVLGVVALAGGGFADEVRAGFTSFLHGDLVLEAAAVGLFSSGTGAFGGLVLLDRSENTFSVPVNRCSSVLAGVVASYLLVFLVGKKPPGGGELLGAGLIVVAILFLTIPAMKRRPAPG